MFQVKRSQRDRNQVLPALCTAIYCAAGSHAFADTPPDGNTVPLRQSVAAAGTTDAELRFQEGLRLAAANKTEAAIKMFSGLTVDYPLLPQPYVQLAAQYVQQGKLTKALEALHTAVELRLDDGELQERLGDLYLELARQSYKGALDATHPSPGAAGKYSALQQLGLRPMTGGGDQQ